MRDLLGHLLHIVTFLVSFQSNPKDLDIYKIDIDLRDCLGRVKKVKVSHSLTAVGAVGVRVPLYLGHS